MVIVFLEPAEYQDIIWLGLTIRQKFEIRTEFVTPEYMVAKEWNISNAKVFY